MKIRNFTFAILLLTAILFAGCGGGTFCMHPKGEVVTQTISLEAITGLELAISGNVTLHRDSVQKIEITGHQNIIDNIERDVVSGIWEIEFDECVRKTGELEIEIWLPTLTDVILSGSGNIKGMDEFTGGSNLNVVLTGSGNIDLQADAATVNVDLTGSGSIDLAADATQVDLTITGSGDVDLKGTCVDEDLKITGSGDIRAFGMLSETASVVISGSGNCELTASNHLDVNISGSGNVYYKGTPTVDTQISGSGRVQHVN